MNCSEMMDKVFAITRDHSEKLMVLHEESLKQVMLFVALFVAAFCMLMFGFYLDREAKPEQVKMKTTANRLVAAALCCWVAGIVVTMIG